MLTLRAYSGTAQYLREQVWSFVAKKTNTTLHIVSINPENVVQAVHKQEFANVYAKAELCIVDGVGVYFACKASGFTPTRITGVDCMSEILEYIDGALEKQNTDTAIEKLKVLLVGAGPEVALKLSQKLCKLYQNIDFESRQGPKNREFGNYQINTEFANILKSYNPKIIFFAFGSPKQELFIESHRELFAGRVVMGVGGAFDMLLGNVARSPLLLRRFGLEWLWRLILQPWRIKRQLKLIEYVYLVLSGKVTFVEKK